VLAYPVNFDIGFAQGEMIGFVGQSIVPKAKFCDAHALEICWSLRAFFF